MKKILLTPLLTTMTSILMFPPIHAQDNGGPPKNNFSHADEVKEMASLPVGVQKPDTVGGLLKSLYVTGRARIPTSMGEANATLFAERGAAADAKKNLIEWMKQHVKSVDIKNGEMICATTSSNSSGDIEANKTLDSNSNSVTTMADGLIRGLEPKGEDVSRGMMTLVYRWSSTLVGASLQAETLNNQEAPNQPKDASAAGTAAASKPSASQGQVKDRTVVSPDFNKD